LGRDHLGDGLRRALRGGDGHLLLRGREGRSADHLRAGHQRPEPARGAADRRRDLGGRRAEAHRRLARDRPTAVCGDTALLLLAGPELLAAGGALVADNPDIWVTSHINENRDEVTGVAQIHPEALDYLDTYDRAGLLGRRT